jgi:DnaD/phage-associated family protein
MTKRIVLNILADRPIAYHPDIARVAGSVKAGIFLSQLLYWADKGKRNDGYIWKTQDEWEEETALTRYEQEGARKELKARGLLHEKRRGIPAKLYYKIDTDTLYSLLEKLYLQTSMRKTHILESGKPANSKGENPQSITESTSESTSESTNNKNDDDFSAAVSAYENNIAMITPMMSETIGEAVDEFGADDIIEAIGLAVKADVRKWSYVNGILKRWRKTGKHQLSVVKVSKDGGMYV